MPDTPDDRRNLWRAVIAQALNDATARSTSPTALVAKRQARAWLTHRSADLDEVCALADLEPDAIRAEAAVLIVTADRQLAAGEDRPGRKDRARPKTEPRRIEMDGQNLTISEWAARTGIGARTITSRLNLGWDHERALTQPVVPGWASSNIDRLQLSKQA